MIFFSREDRVLVTGASSGIGRAIALKLNELGAFVVGIARSTDRLEETKESCSNSINFVYESLDLTENLTVLSKRIDEIITRYGKLRGLVHSAGIQETVPASAQNIDKAKALFDLNYFAFVSLAKSFLKKKNNAGPGSSLLAISSFVSSVGIAGIANYSASKGALDSYVRSLAIEAARYGIRVNAISPGHIRGEFIESKSVKQEEFIKKLEKKYPLGLVEPEDVANASAFLLSDAARSITGLSLLVDAGANINFDLS